jgi:CheY-like chemotaxis protein
VAVHAGARLASKARPGEILISKTTRDLIQGSRISLRDRGSHVLRGLPGRWRLFAVEAMAERPPAHQDKGIDPGIDVMLVDDHPLWREMIRRVLEHDDFSTIVAEASDGGEAVAMAQSARPDVVLMDVNLPGVSGIEATRAILLANPDTKVLVLSSSDERGDVLEAVEAGASGYMLKTSAAREIIEAVRRASAGELVFPHALSQLVLGALRNGRAAEGVPR